MYVVEISTYSSGDRQESVVADQNYVEDGGSTEQIVHHEPQLAESTAQHPSACQDVGHVHGDTECS